MKQKDTLEITEETKNVQTFEDQSLAPKDKKIALRVYNTVNLVNQRKIDYETMEWTNNLQRLLTEVQLWLGFSGKSQNLCQLYSIYEQTDSEKVYLEIELGDLGLIQKFDEDDRVYEKNLEFIRYCNEYFSQVTSESERLILGI